MKLQGIPLLRLVGNPSSQNWLEADNIYKVPDSGLKRRHQLRGVIIFKVCNDLPREFTSVLLFTFFVVVKKCTTGNHCCFCEAQTRCTFCCPTLYCTVTTNKSCHLLERVWTATVPLVFRDRILSSNEHPYLVPC